MRQDKDQLLQTALTSLSNAEIALLRYQASAGTRQERNECHEARMEILSTLGRVECIQIMSKAAQR